MASQNIGGKSDLEKWGRSRGKFDEKNLRVK